jgi:outer membrane receptor for ferrienterochelin and colicin
LNALLNIGRGLGVGQPPVIALYEYRTTRVVAGLERAFGESLALDVTAGWSRNDYDVTIPETIGGCGTALPVPTCVPILPPAQMPPLPPTSPTLGAEETYSLALLGGLFNPFGSSYFGSPNNPAVIDSFLTNYSIDAWTELTTVDAVLTSDVWDMGGGPAGLAVGGQWRKEEAKYDYDDTSNIDNFLFLVGNQDWQNDRDVIAAFAELGLPFAESFDLTLAVRWEDYGDGLDSTDPKIAALWRPIDVLTFRGSFSTSFSVPSLFQENGSQTIVENLTDPLSATPTRQQFKGVRSLSDPNAQLTPQEADIYNLGLSWAATDNLEFGLDYWRFDVTDVIIQESAQSIINADPLDSRIQRDTFLGTIIRVNVDNYANASSLDTDGIDFTGAWTLDDTSSGSWRFGLNGTYVTTYDIEDPQAGMVDGAGNRNFTNFATSVPELRGNLNATWSLGRNSVNAYLRYIDSYDDDQNVDMTTGSFAKVDSFTAFDLQYNFEFSPILGAETGPVITLGAINLFDEEVPGVVTSGGFDSKVHDPRQRLVYLRLAVPFQ